MPNPVTIASLINLFNQLQWRGVRYVYGGKIENKTVNPRSTGRLSTPPDTIDGLDCSGFIRYALYRAADWTIPDGSQNQLDWFQNNHFVPVRDYSDVNADVGRAALYIGFIKPHVNGCGDIGHVWLIYKSADGVAAETIESHGGVGVSSRAWNTFALLHEEFAAFELPAV